MISECKEWYGSLVGDKRDIKLWLELGQGYSYSYIVYTIYWRTYTSPVKLEHMCLVTLKIGESIDLVTRWVNLYDHLIYFVIVDTNDLELILGYNIILLTL